MGWIGRRDSSRCDTNESKSRPVDGCCGFCDHYWSSEEKVGFKNVILKRATCTGEKGLLALKLSF